MIGIETGHQGCSYCQRKVSPTRNSHKIRSVWNIYIGISHKTVQFSHGSQKILRSKQRLDNCTKVCTWNFYAGDPESPDISPKTVQPCMWLQPCHADHRDRRYNKSSLNLLVPVLLIFYIALELIKLWKMASSRTAYCLSVKSIRTGRTTRGFTFR